MPTFSSITPVPSNSTGTTATNNQTLGKDDFLKLLIAQLQAQDPLSPLEGQEFSAQLAQFSSLEQITNVNKNLIEIQKFEAALANSSAINLIGKTVDAPGNTVDLKTGQAKTLAFSLADDATQVRIDIFNSIGQKVNTITLNNQSAGNNQFIWNGIDASGKPVGSGKYTFQANAEDGSGNTIESETFVDGLVTDVLFENNEAFAIVNDQKLLVSQISRVSA